MVVELSIPVTNAFALLQLNINQVLVFKCSKFTKKGKSLVTVPLKRLAVLLRVKPKTEDNFW